MKNSFRALTERGRSCLSVEGKKVSLLRDPLGRLCLGKNNTRMHSHCSKYVTANLRSKLGLQILSAVSVSDYFCITIFSHSLRKELKENCYAFLGFSLSSVFYIIFIFICFCACKMSSKLKRSKHEKTVFCFCFLLYH